MKRTMITLPVLATALLLSGCASAATPALAQEPTPGMAAADRTIRVMGTGEIQVQPDQAHVDLGVQTFASTAQAAAEENARILERVIDALVAAGVPRDNIETRNYSVYPEYERPDPREMGGQEPRIRGYRVNNTVSVMTDDLDRVGVLIDTALEAGANQVNSVRFSLEDADAAQAEATRRAVEQARQSAETIAAALGVRLGPVVDASTTADPVRPFPMATRARVESMEMAAMDVPTPIEPGEQTVTARVSVVYAIEG